MLYAPLEGAPFRGAKAKPTPTLVQAERALAEAARRAEELRAWLDIQLQGGARALNLISATPACPDEPVSPLGGVRMASAQAVVDLDCAEWSAIWTRHPGAAAP